MDVKAIVRGIAALGLALTGVAASAAGLDPAMNGEYRCDNGETFSAQVRMAPQVSGGVGFVEHKGRVSATAQHGLDGLEYYGVHVRHAGKKYKLYPVDGEPDHYTDNKGRFGWTLVDGKAPYTGRIAGKDGTIIGDNCRQAAPADNQ